jgi:cytoskeletal protein CcmA (bactofilin family)
MGIKENFAQAMRDLTGGGKDTPEKAPEPAKAASQVDDLRRAVETETAEARPAPAPAETQQPAAVPKLYDTLELTPSFPQKPVEDDSNLILQKSAPQAQQTANPLTSPPLTNPFKAAAPAAQPPAPHGLGYVPQSGTVASHAPGAELPGSDEELTVISKNTVVDGNIRSFANMNIDGNIRGDIETTKNIELNGKVVGNLTCNNAQMITSQVQGNIRMKGNVIMGRDTLLIGDLVSTYAKVNGKIKGNIEIGGKAELKGDAVIFGDISASTITVDDGAIIQGYVSTTFLNKEESRNIFPESISIAE